MRRCTVAVLRQRIRHRAIVSRQPCPYHGRRMSATAPVRLQIVECARNAAVVTFLAAISIAPLYTNGRAILGLADAPAAEPESALLSAPAQARPAAPAA